MLQPAEVGDVTAQEEQLLHSLIERVNSTRLEEKDPEAEALLNRGFGSNPDAFYVLAQTVLVQNIGLEQAKAQVSELERQLEEARRQPAPSRGFLGNLLGRHEAPPVAPPEPPYQQPPPFQPVQQVAPPPYQPAAPQPYVPAQQYVPVAAPQPSFLRGALGTAAGVAAGALAFEGVEAALHGIMGHPGYGWGGPTVGLGGFGMGPAMGGGLDRPVEETVINNYYDQPGGGQAGFNQDAPEQNFRESAEPSRTEFADASYNPQQDERGNSDNSNFDDSNDDNAGQDDGSGFDDSGFQDSGGFDDGGGFDGGDNQV
jgi:uncharacterized protein